METKEIIIDRLDLEKISESNNKIVSHHNISSTLKRELDTRIRELDLLNEKIKVLELKLVVEDKNIQIERLTQYRLRKELESKYSIDLNIGSIDTDSGLYTIMEELVEKESTLEIESIR